jgi:hypothetical protein
MSQGPEGRRLMPLEAIALLMQDPKFATCPKCGAAPFTPFMRGQVQRSRWWSRAGIVALVTGQPWDYCAVICGDCKELVGWERPIDLDALLDKYERHVQAKKMFNQWKFGRRVDDGSENQR